MLLNRWSATRSWAAKVFPVNYKFFTHSFEFDMCKLKIYKTVYCARQLCGRSFRHFKCQNKRKNGDLKYRPKEKTQTLKQQELAFSTEKDLYFSVYT